MRYTILIPVGFFLFASIFILTDMDNDDIIFIDTNSDFEPVSVTQKEIKEIIESETIIFDSIIESETPYNPIPISIPTTEINAWTIPIEIAIQPLIEPIQELTKIINVEPPHEPQRISSKDITLNSFGLNSGYYSVFNSNPDQAIDGVFSLHISGHIPIIVKNIHIPANSNYPMKTDLFLGDCASLGTGDPHKDPPCKKKFVMTFYDSKLHKHDSIGSLLKFSNYIPLNQCVGLVDEGGNISHKCKNNIFQQVGGIYERNDRWYK
jgi:hypothetical protein